MSDNLRLGEGYVQLDGRTISSWAYDLNVQKTSAKVTIDTTKPANGTHTLKWVVRDLYPRANSLSIRLTVGN